MVELILADAEVSYFRLIFANECSHSIVQQSILHCLGYHFGVRELIDFCFS